MCDDFLAVSTLEPCDLGLVKRCPFYVRRLVPSIAGSVTMELTVKARGDLFSLKDAMHFGGRRAETPLVFLFAGGRQW